MSNILDCGEIIIRSPRLVEELKTFIITEGGRPDALRGYHDDLILALAGALWVREEAFLFTYRSDELTKAMINSISVNTSTTRDIAESNINRNNPTAQLQMNRAFVVENMNANNTITLPGGEIESLDWLLPSKS